MLASWPARYLDGVSAQAEPVTATPTAHGLEIRRADGRLVVWPYAELAQTQGHYPGEHVRLERGSSPVEALVVEDPAFLAQLHKVAPRVAHRFHDPKRRARRPALVAMAFVGAIAAGAALYFWIIPGAATFLAERVPVAWEEELGEAVKESLTESMSECRDHEVLAAVNDLVARLAAARADNPYTFRVSVMREDTMNAFAAPGGHIVIFSGLLRRTDRPEELAGILAHEMSHVLHRHGTKSLFREVSTSILLAAIVGDANGGMGTVLESAKTLGGLHYSRKAEEEADLDGLHLLAAARIDPSGIVSFFEKLEKREPKLDRSFLKYLSTHPLTGERIERLKTEPAMHAGRFQPLPYGPAWTKLAAACDPPERRKLAE